MDSKKSLYVLKKVPKSVVCKTEDDAVPLPDPFLLPKFYRADVEVALKSSTMTEDTTRAFLSCVAASMFTYKGTQLQMTTETSLELLLISIRL